MAINRKKKEELVATYTELLKKSPALVFTNYKGSNVATARSLRAKLKDTGTTYVVVKNTLLGLALKQLGRTVPEHLLVGSNAVVFCGEDVGKSVTGLNEWLMTNKTIEVTGALLETTILDAAGAATLSDLPTKEQMRAMLLGVISAPARQLVQIVNAPGASLARVINAHVDAAQEAA